MAVGLGLCDYRVSVQAYDDLGVMAIKVGFVWRVMWLICSDGHR